MTIKDAMKRVGAAVAVSAVSAAGLLGAAAPASAVEPNKVKLCSYGDYSAFLYFPNHNKKLGHVAPGDCKTFDVPKYPGDTQRMYEDVQAWGAVHHSEFYIDKGRFGVLEGATIYTFGTVSKPQAAMPHR